MTYDSTKDTLLHIRKVQHYLNECAVLLIKRGLEHDDSKLDWPEKELFDAYTPLLKKLKYGSDEYKESLEKLKPALDHHYMHNDHHPEYFEDGIDGMSLIQLLEMFCDWKAASERTENGSIEESINVGVKRFDISPQLENIFRNTAQDLGWN